LAPIIKMTRSMLISYVMACWLVHQSFVNGFSASSSFVCGDCRSTRSLRRSTTNAQQSAAAASHLVMYGDAPNSPELNAWSVIATTERWISDTLKSSNQLASSTSASNGSLSVGGNNPYARKEVSYYCETSKETSMIVAGIFRMLKEARERGEQHGTEEEQRADALGKLLNFCNGVFTIFGSIFLRNWFS
jgi:transposase-like protein